MGTHPIFESDFDCLTEWRRKRKFSELITRHCESTSAPTDPPLFRRILGGSTPTKCAVAGSTTPTSTDAYTSANTWERTPKSAATSVTTFCSSATEISSNKWTSNERTRFSHPRYIPAPSRTRLSGSQSTKRGRSTPKPERPAKPSTANFFNRRSKGTDRNITLLEIQNFIYCVDLDS